MKIEVKNPNVPFEYILDYKGILNENNSPYDVVGKTYPYIKNENYELVKDERIKAIKRIILEAERLEKSTGVKILNIQF